MAAHLRENLYAQSAAHVCDEIAAGLDADPSTQDLVPLWHGLSAKGDALGLQCTQFLRALNRTRARVHIADVRWDADVSGFARDVLNESDGKRDQPPNTRFFAKTPSSEAEKFGIEREVLQGRAWLLELERDPAEALSVKWTAILKASTDALELWSEARKAALSACAMHRTSETLYMGEINIEIDKLEGELKKRFPRQPKRVAAYLAPTRLRRNEKAASEGDDDAGSAAPAP